ncbi:MAG: hypothetical protein JW863_16170 [Chitinispirillaceae bacterium]|nr:hypothetical protein [Chitinispirillaceae bacterium]
MHNITSYQMLLWLTPVLMLAVGFLSSMVTRFRFTRYGIYCLILFIAFLFDLQSKSFFNDRYDLIFTQLLVWVFADFFWRMVRRKNRILRIAGLVIGLVVFVWNYYEWIIVGPASLNRLWNAQVLTEKNAKKTVYFVKKRCPVRFRKESTCNLVLLKRVVPSFLEQRIDLFQVPEGYEAANLTFVWQRIEELETVQVIGNNDTLWTLTEKFPQ